MIKKRFLLFTILLLLLQTMSYGETDKKQPAVDYFINWENQNLEISITSYISDMNTSLPSIKTRINKGIMLKLPYILLKGIQLLTIDSKTNGEEYVKMHPSVIASIFELTPKLEKKYSIFSSDFKSLNTKYTIDLYPDIVKLFISHTRTNNITPGLDFIPSADFSGIAIYVDAELPMYGKYESGPYYPSLFPKIYDEELNLVFSPLMVDPDIIKKNGTVGYQGLSDTLNLARIGQSPLTLKARGIFGINNTDLIISKRDAEKILSRQSNLDLFKKGKILIIYNTID